MWGRMIDEPGNVGCYCILEGLECLLLVSGAHLRTKGREAITFFFFFFKGDSCDSACVLQSQL